MGDQPNKKGSEADIKKDAMLSNAELKKSREQFELVLKYLQLAANKSSKNELEELLRDRDLQHMITTLVSPIRDTSEIEWPSIKSQAGTGNDSAPIGNRPKDNIQQAEVLLTANARIIEALQDSWQGLSIRKKQASLWIANHNGIEQAQEYLNDSAKYINSLPRGARDELLAYLKKNEALEEIDGQQKAAELKKNNESEKSEKKIQTQAELRKLKEEMEQKKAQQDAEAKLAAAGEGQTTPDPNASNDELSKMFANKNADANPNVNIPEEPEGFFERIYSSFMNFAKKHAKLIKSLMKFPMLITKEMKDGIQEFFGGIGGLDFYIAINKYKLSMEPGTQEDSVLAELTTLYAENEVNVDIAQFMNGVLGMFSVPPEQPPNLITIAKINAAAAAWLAGNTNRQPQKPNPSNTESPDTTDDTPKTSTETTDDSAAEASEDEEDEKPTTNEGSQESETEDPDEDDVAEEKVSRKPAVTLDKLTNGTNMLNNPLRIKLANNKEIDIVFTRTHLQVGTDKFKFVRILGKTRMGFDEQYHLGSKEKELLPVFSKAIWTDKGLSLSGSTKFTTNEGKKNTRLFENKVLATDKVASLLTDISTYKKPFTTESYRIEKITT